MTERLNFEQRLVIILPIAIGFIFPSISFSLGLFIMRGISITESFVKYIQSYPPFTIIIDFRILPYIILALYLSKYVRNCTRREAYFRFLGGLGGIIFFYIPTEWYAYRPYQGGGADIGLGLFWMVKPLIGIVTMGIGLALGAKIERLLNKT